MEIGGGQIIANKLTLHTVGQQFDHSAQSIVWLIYIESRVDLSLSLSLVSVLERLLRLMRRWIFVWFSQQ